MSSAIKDANPTFIGISPTFPCGACRQVLAEFNPKMKIYVDGDDNEYLISELLSHSFQKID